MVSHNYNLLLFLLQTPKSFLFFSFLCSQKKKKKKSAPKRVLVTGAAGQISYSLIFLITRGELFGADQPIILHLLDVPFCVNGLNGVVMEIQDCASPVIQEVVATTDVEVAFKDIDVAILVGAFPRKDGMERKDLLAKNASIFKEQGQALNRLAKKDVKVNLFFPSSRSTHNQPNNLSHSHQKKKKRFLLLETLPTPTLPSPRTLRLISRPRTFLASRVLTTTALSIRSVFTRKQNRTTEKLKN